MNAPAPREPGPALMRRSNDGPVVRVEILTLRLGVGRGIPRDSSGQPERCTCCRRWCQPAGVTADGYLCRSCFARRGAGEPPPALRAAVPRPIAAPPPAPAATTDEPRTLRERLKARFHGGG